MDPDGVIESNWDQVVTSFDDMNLKEELLRGIYAYGFEKPSAIQQRAILPCIRGKQATACIPPCCRSSCCVLQAKPNRSLCFQAPS